MTLSAPPASPTAAARQWDIVCRVIDNFGDIGVCWRLAAELARRGQQVRLWTDDASALAWLAPQGCPGVQVRAFGGLRAAHEPPTEVLVEAFGCDPAPDFIAQCAQHASATGQKYVWINLEYLSAEGYVERCHGLPSPAHGSGAAGDAKWFFYPGFTPATGGLLREHGLLQRQARFDRAAWRQRHGAAPDQGAQARWFSLFCYEPPALPALLAQCRTQPTHWLVTPGRAAAATRAALQADQSQNTLQGAWDKREQLSISYLSYQPQDAFDEMLWACDLNFVRGEDSLVRALWAGQPLVWQIYPQHDDAHHGKLHAFLDWLQAPAALRQFHAVWNGLEQAALPQLDAGLLAEWGACVRAARTRLLAQPDLVTQLLNFVRQKTE